MQFGELIIWYLFLGGLGGGVYVAWYVLRLRFVAAHLTSTQCRALRAIGNKVDSVALGTLFIGSVCLLIDVGDISKVHLLFVRPTLSALSVGAYALVAFMFFRVGACYLRARSGGVYPRHVRAASVVDAISVCLAVVVVVYTGIFFGIMSSVPLWNNWLLPLLFVLSALSTGLATLCMIVSFSYFEVKGVRTLLLRMVRVDEVIIVLEIVVMLGLYAMLQGNPVAHASFQILLEGDCAVLFWLGCVGGGLVLPLLLGAALSPRTLRTWLWFAGIGCCVLVGGFSLRYCAVCAGLKLSMLLVGLP